MGRHEILPIDWATDNQGDCVDYCDERFAKWVSCSATAAGVTEAALYAGGYGIMAWIAGGPALAGILGVAAFVLTITASFIKQRCDDIIPSELQCPDLY